MFPFRHPPAKTDLFNLSLQAKCPTVSPLSLYTRTTSLFFLFSSFSPTSQGLLRGTMLSRELSEASAFQRLLCVS